MLHMLFPQMDWPYFNQALNGFLLKVVISPLSANTTTQLATFGSPMFH